MFHRVYKARVLNFSRFENRKEIVEKGFGHGERLSCPHHTIRELSERGERDAGLETLREQVLHLGLELVQPSLGKVGSPSGEIQTEAHPITQKAGSELLKRDRGSNKSEKD